MHALFFRELLETDVDVIQYFHVVAQESDRLHKHSSMTFFFQSQNCALNRRAKPGPARHALTLERKPPIAGRKGYFTRHQHCRFLGLRLVRVTLGNGPLRNAMSGENHRHAGGCLLASVLPTAAKFLGEGFDEKWMVMPGVDESHSKRCAAFDVQRGAIQSHAGARILRRQTDYDRMSKACRFHYAARVRDQF